jgi:signal transduction histidine kinase
MPFWNLLSNAIKFTPAGGRVALRVSRELRHISIEISDTGEGIRPELLPHVFERFRKGESVVARRHGGLGLGLRLVEQLVRMHGGEVTASSDGEGQGATFVVRLPLAPA